MSVAEIEELAPASANGEDETVDIPGLGRQMRLVLQQQAQLIERVKENSSHVVKLHQMHDPLTWKKRAAILFAGAFAGAGVSTATALFLMHLTIHISAH